MKNIHQLIYKAVSEPNALAMADWHTCETTHCRAGWVTHLAGEEGKELEEFFGTALAASKIYRASSEHKVPLWRFFENAEDAMADMKRLAELEGEGI